MTWNPVKPTCHSVLLLSDIKDVTLGLSCSYNRKRNKFRNIGIFVG